ncbi:MAG: VOC family protein [Armatimonadetes bacterium]|nr:VOC family protein [Armatimonadota bacterium]
MATDTMEQMALNQGKTFCWHELYVPKAQEAIDFYTNALGFGSEDMQMGDGMTYRMLTRNGQGVAGVWGTTENEQMKNTPPHWSTYLAVDDVDARLQRCQDLGAQVIVPPMDVPGIGRMALIQDPFGAMIWIFRGADSA